MQQLEYKLKYILNTRLLKITNLRILNNDSDIFDKKFAKSNIQFLFTKNIEKSNIEFPIFNIPLSKEGTMHKVYFCKVAVGNAIYNNRKNSYEYNPPNSFDNFIIPKEEVNIKQALEKEIELENYAYLIKERNRILPLYEVEFYYDRSKSENENICEACYKKPAVMFCKAEKAHFCEECDMTYHSNALTKRHERVFFENVGEVNFTECRYHNSVIEYFCPKCLEPLCLKCITIGSHSALPTSNHDRLSYIDAIKKYSYSFDTESYRRSVLGYRASITDLKTQIRLFNENYTEVYNEIVSRYKSALNELHIISTNYYHQFASNIIQFTAFETQLKNIKELTERFNSSEMLLNFSVIKEEVEKKKGEQLKKMQHKPFELKGYLEVQEEDNKEN